MTPQDYLTLQQLADCLRRSKRTVQRMIQHGQGPPFIQLGRRRLFAKSSVTEWLKNKEHLSHTQRQDTPQLDIVGALGELESHGENSTVCHLFLSEKGELLSLEAVERYLHRLLAAGIKRVLLAPV